MLISKTIKSVSLGVHFNFCSAFLVESSEPKHDFFKLLPQQVDCVVSKLGSPNIVKLFRYVGFLNLQGFGFQI